MEFRSPVYQIKAVPVEKIIPNTYNPNTVAPPELRLLYDSIREDGYTMPIVCYYCQSDDTYIIVDGFHRYRVMLEHRDIYEREKGLLPVSVIDKPLAQRMASTIRHNRARGSHDVDLMSNIVRELHDLGRSDAWISRHLGMDRDEILRLKQITGLVSLFRETNFKKKQIQSISTQTLSLWPLPRLKPRLLLAYGSLLLFSLLKCWIQTGQPFQSA